MAQNFNQQATPFSGAYGHQRGVRYFKVKQKGIAKIKRRRKRIESSKMEEKNSKCIKLNKIKFLF